MTSAHRDDLLPAPPGDAETIALHPGNLDMLRHFVASHSRRAGLGEDRIQDLLLAVNEVATNTLIHTAVPGTLRVWWDTPPVPSCAKYPTAGTSAMSWPAGICPHRMPNRVGACG